MNAHAHNNSISVWFCQEERKKMKEEIERRRAEAAEKKKQMGEESADPKQAFSCLTPKGPSKVGSLLTVTLGQYTRVHE